MALSSPSPGGRPPYNRDNRRNNDPFAAIRRNMRIKSPQVRVISPVGRQLGIMDTQKAIALAMQFNLDLVEVAAAATPPVCRIMDFGKYVYEEQKKHAHSKPAGAKLKEIEFTVRIEKHDFDTKTNHARSFIGDGNKVKVTLMFRGRQIAHPELGMAVVERVAQALADVAKIETPARLEGKALTMILTPK